MKNKLLKSVALFLLLGMLVTAAACRKAPEHAVSSSAAPESSGAADAGASDADTVTLGPIIYEETEPVYDGPAGVLENLRLLYTRNSDTVGWLTIKNGNGVAFIDFPVVQSFDNNYYLRRSFYGGYAHGGTVFLHFRCDPVDLSKNTVLFGHNLKDNSYFAQLLKYNSAAFYESAPIIEYSTLYKKYQFKIFAAFYSTTKFDYIRAVFPAVSIFTAVIDEARARSVLNTNVDVGGDDSIITLSTCAYVTGVDDARFVVMGRLLHDGESVGGCRASANPDALDIRQKYAPKGA